MKRLSLYLFTEYIVNYCNRHQISISEVIEGLKSGSYLINANYSVGIKDIETLKKDYKTMTIDHFNQYCYHYTVNEEYFK